MYSTVLILVANGANKLAASAIVVAHKLTCVSKRRSCAEDAGSRFICHAARTCFARGANKWR